MVAIDDNKGVKNSPSRKNYECLEQIVGCKWSVSVLLAIEQGIERPGALERYIEGISSKILAERLRKLSHYGLIDKHIFAEVPPRTEYTLTQKGLRLTAILAQLKELDQQSS